MPGVLRPGREQRYRLALAVLGLLSGAAFVLAYPLVTPWSAPLLPVPVLLAQLLVALWLSPGRRPTEIFVLASAAPAWLVLALEPGLARFGPALAVALGGGAVALIAREIELRAARREAAEQARIRRHADEVQAAESASRQKSQFLAAASHDLRQPLHAMNFYIQLLRDENRQDRLGEVIDRVADSARSMSELFNALLDVSRLDAGALSPRVVPFALGPMLARLESEAAPSADERGLRLHVRPTSAWVSSDPMLIERILQNLLSNAIRYTWLGGVLLGCRTRGEHLRIEVWDTGVGIPGGMQEQVFNPFFQVGGSEDGDGSNKGVGLGLSIVRRLAELLEHRVGLRSLPGRGSVFWLELPICPAVPAGEAGNASRPERGVRKGSTIVLIDDELVVRNATEHLLTSWGATVFSGANAAAIVAQASAIRAVPELIIADYRLGGDENGIDAIREVQEEFNAEIPGLIVTGDTAPSRLREITESGHPVLHKPVAPHQLMAAIAKLTSGPGSAASGAADSGAAEPGTHKPGTHKPGTHKPGTAGPGTREPGAAVPDTARY